MILSFYQLFVNFRLFFNNFIFNFFNFRNYFISLISHFWDFTYFLQRFVFQNLFSWRFWLDWLYKIILNVKSSNFWRFFRNFNFFSFFFDRKLSDWQYRLKFLKTPKRSSTPISNLRLILTFFENISSQFWVEGWGFLIIFIEGQIAELHAEHAWLSVKRTVPLGYILILHLN